MGPRSLLQLHCRTEVADEFEDLLRKQGINFASWGMKGINVRAFRFSSEFDLGTALSIRDDLSKENPKIVFE